jgi:hypothetical protein
MLLGFCKAKKLKKMDLYSAFNDSKLSSYWLYFVTSTSYKLASALVSSMKGWSSLQGHQNKRTPWYTSDVIQRSTFSCVNQSRWR